MISDYFQQIELLLRHFPSVSAYSVTKKIFNQSQGHIQGIVNFENGCSLEFSEVKRTDQKGKEKYRYHYMDATKNLIFRYDNAYHHKNIATFPHHKHTAEGVIPSDEPTLESVLFEIAQRNL